MPYIYPPNNPREERLKEVINEMMKLGPPKLRAIREKEHFQALEGSHRLAAAKKLHLPIRIEILKPNNILENHDFQDVPQNVPVSDVLKFLSKSIYDVQPYFFSDERFSSFNTKSKKIYKPEIITRTKKQEIDDLKDYIQHLQREYSYQHERANVKNGIYYKNFEPLLLKFQNEIKEASSKLNELMS